MSESPESAPGGRSLAGRHARRDSVPEFIVNEAIEARAAKLDGAPPDYWQVYADDKGPFEFPLASAWVTKSMAPNSLRLRIRRVAFRAYTWQIVWGILAVRFDMVPLFLVGAVGNLSNLYRIGRLVVSELYPDGAPSFMARLFSLRVPRLRSPAGG